MREIIKLVNDIKYEYLLISTTAKKNVDFQLLPNRHINDRLSLNIQIGNKELAEEIFRSIDGRIDNVLIDIERKQSINLWKIAKKNFKISRLYPYKPNDITMEAADRLLLNHFNSDLENKVILVYGTGNIGTKLALRLAERNSKVYLLGRNKDKVNQIITVLNSVSPFYTEEKLCYFDVEKFKGELDGVISLVSGERVIPEVFANFINENGIAIDGGIGNFSEAFISRIIKRNIRILRLDVRVGLPFIEASVNADGNSFFKSYMGVQKINGVTVVAGGIIGKDGSVIVDKIEKPSQVIGIANGIGGVKNESAFTKGDREAIVKISEYISQSK
ncbi:hypothetical protein [Cytobacillus firmus]|uniref:hypothetical protein n=1 Tax=Cytobacillus firmus TaxID=1399 RepID=UPI00064F9FC6|nr:hypothetical protein [Cytobacillus firmus]KML41334.1 hypothetical protein VL14_11460 [Cytobacillus firmus]